MLQLASHECMYGHSSMYVHQVCVQYSALDAVPSPPAPHPAGWVNIYTPNERLPSTKREEPATDEVDPYHKDRPIAYPSHLVTVTPYYGLDPVPKSGSKSW